MTRYSSNVGLRVHLLRLSLDEAAKTWLNAQSCELLHNFMGLIQAFE